MGRLALHVLVAMAWATPCLAVSVGFEVDETASTMRVELCIQGNCDDDTSRVDGNTEAALDDWETPGEFTLHDFEWILIDDIDLAITIFLGSLEVAGREVLASYALGTPHPPSPVSGTTFTLRDVPTRTEGTMSYSATGTMCALFAGMGLPCDDVIDLASLGTQSAETVFGEVSVAGDAITLVLEPSIRVPLDPANPDLGQVTLSGTIVAHGTAPRCEQPPGPISDLRLVDTGDGIRLDWSPEPNSAEGYRAYSVERKLLLPPNGSNPDATLECETSSAGELSCAAAHSGTPLLLYQVVGLCADGSEGLN